MSSVSPPPVRPEQSRATAACARSAVDRLRRPAYDRSSLIPSVVHLGLGGFHRSHQAVYFDDLAHVAGPRWGVISASLRNRGVVDALRPQKGLYTVIERDASSENARVVGSLVRCVFGPDDPESLVRTLSHPRTQLVTLTITGDAYKIADTSDQPSVIRPLSAWDYLVEALARRRRAGHSPFTVLSCDNIPQNGAAARNTVLATAERRDQLLAQWIRRCVSFPDSMVDRITPAPDPEQQAHLLREFGWSDRCSVVTEPFSQWVVRDDFSGERPPLEQVGVQFVSDVRPYGLIKNRLLNAGHSALAYLAALAGHTWTDEALGDPAIRRYLEELMVREIAPLLPAVPGVELEAYQRTLVARFSNPAIRDPLSRLCARGSTKMPAYLLPSLHEASRRRRPRRLLTLAVAGWLRYLRGSDIRGARLPVEDPRNQELQALALAGGSDPRPLLAKREIFGDLIDDEQFVSQLELALVALDRGGVNAAVAAQLSDASPHAA